METPPPPTSAEYRAVMSRFATGVTVMTSRDGTSPHGMTANAVASVSLEPLLVLVCVERGTEMARIVRGAGFFALSILAADQRTVSNRFAAHDRPLGEAMFTGLGVSTYVTGAPVLDTALAWLDCTVWASYDGGDHEIVVGQVRAAGLGDDRAALAYYRSTYQSVTAT